ncbi:MAG: cytochrome c biogenesis heme-transporting ATPase CcmA [Gammaproteobacteria bacterium]|nr:cytochrome c biogenesis heme-transporting ATPase CcmA [Gammaproteobacteria bacterium]
MTTESNSLHASQLRCERGNRTLFTDLSFHISSGQLLQIEGANGSGKTTLLRSLCGLFEPSAGNIFWCQQPINADSMGYHTQLSYVGHLPGFKLDLSPLENLAFAQGMLGQQPHPPALMSALDNIGLYGFETTPCRALSAGQRRRVALARLLLTKTPLWILDEPYTALDRAGTDRLNALLVQHLQTGGLVILTSHQSVNLQAVTIQRLALQ